MMRRRLGILIPIVLTALLVHVFAPVAACWAASLAASDPFAGAPICSAAGNSAGGHHGSGGQGGHDCCYSMCCPAHVAATPGPPPGIVATSAPLVTPVVWRGDRPLLRSQRTRTHAQARAPPVLI